MYVPILCTYTKHSFCIPYKKFSACSISMLYHFHVLTLKGGDLNAQELDSPTGRGPTTSDQSGNRHGPNLLRHRRYNTNVRLTAGNHQWQHDGPAARDLRDAWSDELASTGATSRRDIVKLTIGADTATVNGTAVNLVRKSQVINNRTLVPLRFRTPLRPDPAQASCCTPDRPRRAALLRLPELRYSACMEPSHSGLITYYPLHLEDGTWHRHPAPRERRRP